MSHISYENLDYEILLKKCAHTVTVLASLLLLPPDFLCYERIRVPLFNCIAKHIT
jgi:hypothetical protein